MHRLVKRNNHNITLRKITVPPFLSSNLHVNIFWSLMLEALTRRRAVDSIMQNMTSSVNKTKAKMQNINIKKKMQ